MEGSGGATRGGIVAGKRITEISYGGSWICYGGDTMLRENVKNGKNENETHLY
jgi:hypothetical protein